jgi:hypothetical protein
MGSRVSTDSRNTLCPRVLYGLPLGRRTLSPLAAHAGHFPVPSCSSGQPGVEHTRHAMCYFPFAPLPLFEPSRPSFDVPLLGLPPIRSPLRVDAKWFPPAQGHRQPVSRWYPMGSVWDVGAGSSCAGRKCVRRHRASSLCGCCDVVESGFQPPADSGWSARSGTRRLRRCLTNAMPSSV